jgi:hypothetical protein
VRPSASNRFSWRLLAFSQLACFSPQLAPALDGALASLYLLPTLLLLVAIMRNASSTIRAARASAAVTRFQRLNHLA